MLQWRLLFPWSYSKVNSSAPRVAKTNKINCIRHKHFIRFECMRKSSQVYILVYVLPFSCCISFEMHTHVFHHFSKDIA